MDVRGRLLPLALMALTALSASCRSERPEPRAASNAAAPPTSTSQPSASPAPPQDVAYAGELPPLPQSNFPAARSLETVNAVYAFAARRPDVLRYVPCFCGCERNGHKNNEDCFVAGRDSSGKPRWDAHGMS